MWSMHHGGVGSVLAQTTADRGGECERGEKEGSSHTRPKSAAVTLYGRVQAGVGTIYTGIRTVTIH